MPSSGLGAYQVKIHQIVFGGLFVLLVLMGVRGMMGGGTSNLKILASVTLSVAVLLGMDKHYWLLCPFFFATDLAIPGFKFNGREIACISLIGTYFVRNALHRNPVVSFNYASLFGAPYFIWICFIWLLNPTGMHMFGSETIGGRFYFLLCLGFVALLTLSKIRLDESDCKKLFYVTLFGYVASTVMGTLESFSFGSLLLKPTHYNFITMSYVFVLLICRHHLDGLLSMSWRPFVTGLVLSLGVYSGHRTSFGRMAVAPLAFAFTTGRTRFQTVMLYACFALLLGFVVSGQGYMYELPFSVQRALSFLPAKWDSRFKEYGFQDVFREEMRVRARDAVRESPWTGGKGFTINLSELSWVNQGYGLGSSFTGHALARNWHNVWIGMAADFGLPASILWGLFWFCVHWMGMTRLKKLKYGTWAHTCYMFFFIMIIYSFLKSFTDGGHSARTPFESYIWFGFMLAILNGVKQTTQADPKAING